jgi:tryptophan-rich sensory protein
MLAVIDRRDSVGRFTNILLAVGVCMLINAFVFGTGFANAVPTPFNDLWYAPAGYVVGIVWIFLYAGMGAARHLLVGAGDDSRKVRWLIVALLLFCAIYPFYTSGFSNILACLWGNIVTIALTIFTISRASRFSRLASLLLVPTVIWVSFATFVIVRQQGWF